MNGELHLAFKLRDEPLRTLVERYAGRAAPFRKVDVIEHGPKAGLPAAGGRTWRVLCDMGGRSWSTEELAARWRDREEAGTATAQFLVGGSDGWPGGAANVDETWSLGRHTMPHQLAAAVVAEQLYRVLTVLAGHPYHLGHGAGA